MREILGVTPEPLYYISAVAGFVMVAGGMWLIYKEKIYIDRESKTITEVETPFGKFKTNIPALVLFVLGFYPLIYPIVKSASVTAEVPVRGEVKCNHYPVEVVAVIDSDVVDKEGSFTLKVPFFGGDNKAYKIIYYFAGNILDTARVSPTSKSPITMESKSYDFSAPNAVTFKPGNVAEKPAGF